MKILGLTGSIGMGKSETARMFRRLGVAVFDADASVHRLTAKGGAAVAAIGEAFPGSVVEGRVDRARLGPQVLGDPAALKRLERIIHPLVGRERQRFLSRARFARKRLVVMDVPLLFETRGERRCHAVAVVYAPPLVRRLRVMRRPGMTEQKLRDTVARQMADAEKLRRADFVVPTGLGLRRARDAVRRVLRKMRG
ncbi:MAG: dephospho-CoA kinase [Alphaproteobacteria bacterium]|nr:dephospho-CoA kinase [Alphaproteobacteria bacterium]